MYSAAEYYLTGAVSIRPGLIISGTVRVSSASPKKDACLIYIPSTQEFLTPQVFDRLVKAFDLLGENK